MDQGTDITTVGQQLAPVIMAQIEDFQQVASCHPGRLEIEIPALVLGERGEFSCEIVEVVGKRVGAFARKACLVVDDFSQATDSLLCKPE
jgi:hypothetical protein